MGDICVVFFFCFDFEMLFKTLLKYYQFVAFILLSNKTILGYFVDQKKEET
jgi:hypothetical protein